MLCFEYLEYHERQYYNNQLKNIFMLLTEKYFEPLPKYNEAAVF